MLEERAFALAGAGDGQQVVTQALGGEVDRHRVTDVAGGTDLPALAQGQFSGCQRRASAFHIRQVGQVLRLRQVPQGCDVGYTEQMGRSCKVILPARHAGAQPSFPFHEQAPGLSLRHAPGDEVAPRGGMVLPVGSHQVIEYFLLLLPAPFVLGRGFPPVPVDIHQRRPGKGLPDEVLPEPSRGRDIVCRYSPRLGRKHEEAQAHAIGWASCLFLHQAHIVDGSHRHTAPDL